MEKYNILIGFSKLPDYPDLKSIINFNLIPRIN